MKKREKMFLALMVGVLLISYVIKTEKSKRRLGMSNDTKKEKICPPPVGHISTGYYGQCPENFQKLLLLKNSLKDPSSLEVISVEQLEEGKIKVKFRAKNGFGGYNVETKILR